MSEDWLEVSIDGAQESADTLEQWLFDAGALSVTLRDSVDDEQLSHAVLEPVPGEVRLWADVTLVGLFAQASVEAEVEADLQTMANASGLQPPPAYRMRRLPDQVWERAWMDSFKPMRFGRRLWICPTQTQAIDEHAITLKLDPGLAFGTGTHATTAQCLDWLGAQTENELQPLVKKTVIDYGCGSGVLAIAALLLGADHAWAVDIDEQALQATRENASINGVSDRLSVGQPDILSDVAVNIVMANILFQPLMLLADSLSMRVLQSGSLVMSGILEEQMEPLRMRYNDNFLFAKGQCSEGWALMSATRR